mmetsp:Transcript_11376/g.18831  ORF Transcript_11376/g.18831 Transcript_11376/m.18831 type:complete len:335 (+) Transcript_11376:164-1168(+)|eukprot:CAMPEP_0119013120 /NCGR_PEP_ID=MMETSP1176-20130426/7953_1 /TAXON_ID=265551 /ORGANISM="Synedropsis recta cf, Strain CCMP1620" /LENGTH=334 /DNA_ID=CAMNT_0006966175 /DNA_START=162 /DNA_END=1166 /DNA_ORIENTATION=-
MKITASLLLLAVVSSFASAAPERKTYNTKQVYKSKPFGATDSKIAPKQVGVPLNKKPDPRELSVDNSNACFLDVSVTCSPKDNSVDSCETLFKSPKTTECTAAATELMFGFTGGNCANSFNMESANSFICRDFHGGPAQHDGDENYIVASSPRAVGNKYFSGTVSVKSAFTLMDESSEDGMTARTIMPETMILVYADESMEKLLQLMIFKTECDNDISLGDAFGSVELVSFTSGDTVETSIAVAMYEITIKNNADTVATIADVHTLVDHSPHDLYKSLKGQTIESGDEISIVEEMSVDLFLTEHEHYVSAFVSAVAAHACSAIGQLDIDFAETA